MTTDQTTEQSKKRKRLTLEEQIARQQELLEKDKESLAKKQKRLRSLNASKMNKDRINAQKKRNSMLIQLGLFFIDEINNISQGGCEEFIDIKSEHIKCYISDIENKIEDAENKLKNNYDEYSESDIKKINKYISDKNILIDALKNIEKNYLKYGKAKLEII